MTSGSAASYFSLVGNLRDIKTHVTKSMNPIFSSKVIDVTFTSHTEILEVKI